MPKKAISPAELAARRVKARELRAADMPIKDIAALLGVHEATVSRDVKDLPKKRIVKDGYKFPLETIHRMRSAHAQHNVPQIAIAKMVDASPQTISRFMRGEARVSGNVSRGNRGRPKPAK
jgi:IS30 family transposase